MTAFNRALLYPHKNTPPPASRKDVLGVGQSLAPGVETPPVHTVSKWLESLGFVISQVAPRHWILTHSSSLPELHFYSLAELGQFAAQRSHQYATPFSVRTL